MKYAYLWNEMRRRERGREEIREGIAFILLMTAILLSPWLLL